MRRGCKAFGSPGTGPGEVIREARCRRGGRWEVIPTPTPTPLLPPCYTGLATNNRQTSRGFPLLDSQWGPLGWG